MMYKKKTANDRHPPSNKETVNAFSVLGKAVQHRADEICFQQRLSYESTVHNATGRKKKKTDVNRHVFYLTYTYII